jgi:hypothetical protein
MPLAWDVVLLAGGDTLKMKMKTIVCNFYNVLAYRKKKDELTIWIPDMMW